MKMKSILSIGLVIATSLAIAQPKPPALSTARSIINKQNIPTYFAKKHDYTANQLVIETMGSPGKEVFLSHTKAGEYFNWPIDKATAVYKMTTPKNKDGVWYTAQAHVVFVRSECATPYDCYLLDDWKFVDAFITDEQVKGTKKLSQLIVSDLVINYLSEDSNKQKMFDQAMSRPYEKLAALIRLDSITIWSEKVESPAKRTVTLYLHGIEAVYNDEISEIKQLNPVQHEFEGYFELASGKWSLTDMKYFRPWYEDEFSADGELYNYWGNTDLKTIYGKYDLIFPDPKSEFVMKEFCNDFFTKLGSQPTGCKEVAGMMLPEDHKELQLFFTKLNDLGFTYEIDHRPSTEYYEPDSPKNQISCSIEISHPKPKKVLDDFAALGISAKYVEQMKRYYKTNYLSIKFATTTKDGKWYAKLRFQ